MIDIAECVKRHNLFGIHYFGKIQTFVGMTRITLDLQLYHTTLGVPYHMLMLHIENLEKKTGMQRGNISWQECYDTLLEHYALSPFAEVWYPVA